MSTNEKETKKADVTNEGTQMTMENGKVVFTKPAKEQASTVWYTSRRKRSRRLKRQLRNLLKKSMRWKKQTKLSDKLIGRL